MKPGLVLDVASLEKQHPRIIRQLRDDGSLSYTMLCDSQLCVSVELPSLWLFKLFLNLEYHVSLCNVYKFFEAKMYRLKGGMWRILPKVNEVSRLLKLMVIKSRTSAGDIG